MDKYIYIDNVLPLDRQNYIEEYSKFGICNFENTDSIVKKDGKQRGYNIPFINEKNPSIGKDIVHMSKSMMKNGGE